MVFEYIDNTAEEITFGNKNLPEGTPQRPLATFALFAYNQEKYIRQAAEGALSQTYSPLEIILSDDCSCDNTYSILRQLAADYSGIHRVRLRKNIHNLGICSHVEQVFKCASGQLIIMAAGDDISMPDRTSILVAEWTSQPNILALTSAWHNLGSNKIITRNVPANMHEVLSWKQSINGAAAAYDRSLVDRFRPMLSGGIIEDGVFALRVFLLGGAIKEVTKPLLIIRENAGITSRDTSKSLSYSLPSVRQLRYTKHLFNQWRRDLLAAGFCAEYSEASKLRITRLTQLSLATRPKIKKSLLVLSLRQRGIKQTLFDILAWRHPKILALYLSGKRHLGNKKKIT